MSPYRGPVREAGVQHVDFGSECQRYSRWRRAKLPIRVGRLEVGAVATAPLGRYVHARSAASASMAARGCSRDSQHAASRSRCTASCDYPLSQIIAPLTRDDEEGRSSSV
jgi:hypothetical protein